MRQPELVAECAAEMIATQGREVTVKCRIGVDDQEPREILPQFLETVTKAGVRRFTIHARKAWLQGLSPKENRDIPPLDYGLVQEMKAAYPALHLSINGGIETLDAAEAFLAAGLDGVMIGRAAYHTPADILLEADARIYGRAHATTARQAVIDMGALYRGAPVARWQAQPDHTGICLACSPENRVRGRGGDIFRKTPRAPAQGQRLSLMRSRMWMGQGNSTRWGRRDAINRRYLAAGGHARGDRWLCRGPCGASWGRWRDHPCASVLLCVSGSRLWRAADHAGLSCHVACHDHCHVDPIGA